MELLGRRTAEMRLAFSQPTGEPAFDLEAATPDDLAGWASKLRDEAARTLDELERAVDGFAPDLRAATCRLLKLRDELMSRIGPPALAGAAVCKMRYHGDYHLGQVLRVENDFVITDFEGEPGRSLEERQQKHSPLRDVAGMLRSFSYVSAVAANHTTAERPGDRHRLGPLVHAWEIDASTAFLRGYHDVVGSGIGKILPSDPDAAERMIGFFIIEKALYELRYEMSHRLDWLPIPLFSLVRVLEDREIHYEI